MKTIRKVLFPTIVCLLIFTCSDKEESIDAPDALETIETEEGLDIKFEYLTVVTIDGESDVDEDGGFNANTASTTSEELPILFTKDDEIMFGYYSKTGDNNTVSVDDMLLFYYSVNSELGVQGLSNSVLMEKIKSSPDYSKLKNFVTTSLNANTSPLKSSKIIDLIISSSKNMLIDIRGYKTNKTKGGGDEWEYKFTHSRDGKIEWNKEVPLFASVGITIKNKNDNVVFGPEILDAKSLVLSPTSLVNYVIDTYFKDDTERKGTFTLQEDSDYTISYTNGSSPRNDLLEEKTREANNEVLISELISLAVPVPKALKKMIKDAKCKDAFEGLFEGVRDIAAQQIVLGKNPTPEELVKWVENLSVGVSNVSVSCISSVSWNKYLVTLLKAVDLLRKVESISELIFYSRDYFGSNIYGDEKRYFYDGISFGYLKNEPISPRDFEGQEGSEHLYASNIKEKITTYTITRGLTESTFIPKEEYEVADGLPFEINRAFGDATIVEVSPVESFQGLFVHFKMGSEDSQFEIKSSFTGNGLSGSERINLKVAVDSIPIYMESMYGKWDMTIEGEAADLELNPPPNKNNIGRGRWRGKTSNGYTPPWWNYDWTVVKGSDGRYYYRAVHYDWWDHGVFEPLSYPVTQIKSISAEYVKI